LIQDHGSADQVPLGGHRANLDPKEGAEMNAHVEPMSMIRDTTPCHEAMLLTQGGPLARITLNGQVYSLRITRAGKLILTK
jgi:hemin uptake protein HemP